MSSAQHTARSPRLLTLSLLSGAALVFGGCSSTVPDPGNSNGEGSDTPVELTFVSYGGTGQDAMIEAWQVPYTAAHPHVTFANSSPSDPAQVKAQVTTGAVSWDLVSTPPYLASENCGVLYEKISLPDTVDRSQYADGALGECYVSDFQYGTLFAYNTDSFPGSSGPTTIADFFDVNKYPGKRGVVAVPQDGMLEFALLADGVAPADIYPLDVDRALAKWDTVRDVTTFAANHGALLQLVTDGQVDMQLQVQARVQAALDAGTHVRPVWDMTVTSMNGLAIPLGSPHKAAAEAFLGFVLQPEQSARVAEIAGVGTSNLEATPNLSANGAAVNTFGEANSGETFAVDAQWWGKNFSEVSAKLTQWLNG